MSTPDRLGELRSAFPLLSAVDLDDALAEVRKYHADHSPVDDLFETTNPKLLRDRTAQRQLVESYQATIDKLWDEHRTTLIGILLHRGVPKELAEQIVDELVLETTNPASI